MIEIFLKDWLFVVMCLGFFASIAGKCVVFRIMRKNDLLGDSISLALCMWLDFLFFISVLSGMLPQ